MANNQINTKSSDNMGTWGQIISRLVVAAIVLSITAFFTTGFTINNIWSLGFAAIVLTI